MLVIKFPINYFFLSFLVSQECLRLHLEECESRQVVCRSHYWGSHQSHWEPVCLLSSYVFVNSCLHSWFAVKRTLPRGGRYNLSRLNYKYKCTWCSLHHCIYNFLAISRFTCGANWTRSTRKTIFRNCFIWCPPSRCIQMQILTTIGFVTKVFYILFKM